MSYIVWKPEYELGIPVIDHQHQRIVELINVLSDQRDNPKQKEVEKAMFQLVDYTFSHFEFEEALLEDADYMGVDVHKDTHKIFFEYVRDLQARMYQGEDILDEVLEALKNWLLDHIMNDDAAYVETVQTRILGKSPDQHHSWVESTSERVFN